jgi:m7GpppX diphosphatase
MDTFDVEAVRKDLASSHDGDTLTALPPTTAGPLALESLTTFILVSTLVIDPDTMRIVLLGYLTPTAAIAAAIRASLKNPSSVSEVLSAAELDMLARITAAWAPVKALLTLQKRAFDATCLDDLFSATGFSLRSTHENDIYAQFLATALPLSQNTVKVDLIYPAAERHIAKATPSPALQLRETPALYAAAHLPLVRTAQASGALSWVYNILDKKKEAERILYEDTDDDTGFVLSADTKVNPVAMASALAAGCLDTVTTTAGGAVPGGAAAPAPLSAAAKQTFAAGVGASAPAWQREIYALAIVHRRDLASLRDLTPAHLPLLRNILSAGTRFLSTRFGIRADRIQAYLHYLPSYYHLHVHFCHAGRNSPDLRPGRSHLLADVIANIELCGDYYQRRTLTLDMPAGHPLAAALYKAATVATTDAVTADVAAAEAGAAMADEVKSSAVAGASADDFWALMQPFATASQL